MYNVYMYFVHLKNNLFHIVFNFFSLMNPSYRGVESFTISTINFCIHGSNKRFFDEGLNQAYMLLKLRNNYNIKGNILLL